MFCNPGLQLGFLKLLIKLIACCLRWFTPINDQSVFDQIYFTCIAPREAISLLPIGCWIIFQILPQKACINK